MKNSATTFDVLSVADHSNCTITVTDSSNNQSALLAVTSFTITAPAVVSSTTSSSSSSSHHDCHKKKKKKKISERITYKTGERIAPYITIVTPKIGTLTTKNFSLSARATDRSGMQAIIVSQNGTKKKRANTGSITYTVKKTKNATISVTAYDSLGNAKVAVITIVNGKVAGARYY